MGSVRRRLTRPGWRSVPVAVSHGGQRCAIWSSYVRRTTMHGFHNGMSAGDLGDVAWRKSQRSNSQGACVEIARISDGVVAMRNSRDPQGPALICQRDDIKALV